MAELRIEQVRAAGLAATRRRRKAKRHPAPAFRQRGTALLIALIATTAMALAGVSLIRSTDTSTLIAGNLTFNESALHANDIGIEAGAGRLNTLISSSSLTTASNNYYPDFDSTSPLPSTSRLGSSTPNPITVSGNAIYYVVERMCDVDCITREGLPLYRITVDVIGPRNTRVTTQAMVNATAAFDVDSAIITEEDLEISGNPSFDGSITTVHTNGDIKISGNGDPSPVTDCTAMGSITQCDNASCASGAGYAYIPDIVPSAFVSYADYRMMADGMVYDEFGIFVFDTSGGSYWNGWKRDSISPVRWTCCNGVTPPDGMYYVEGNVNISSNPGSAGTPWEVTIVAEGHIEVSGNPYLADHKDAFEPPGVQNLFMVAGTDLKFNGNATHTIEGIMAAGEQLQISGNPLIEGFIIVRGASNSDGLVSDNNLSGNFTLRYSGGMDTPWGGDGVVRESWRIVHR